MPGSIRSMQLEHVLRNVQTDRGSLLHGRLLRWQFDTVTLAHRCRRGASTPSPRLAVYEAARLRQVRADYRPSRAHPGTRTSAEADVTSTRETGITVRATDSARLNGHSGSKVSEEIGYPSAQ